MSYNVYNQPVSPVSSLNNMPTLPSQLPSPGQTTNLSTSRVSSTIPKGSTSATVTATAAGATSGATWQFPSQQMFYNALVRKGKAEDVHEKDMSAVINVHNSMNEHTWAAVQTWESLHTKKTGAAAGGASLLRFCGRPFDLSPRARWRGLCGGDKPFDRHDWFILRDGKEIRYVIDFYFDETKAGRMDAFTVDVRPALDSVENVVDRVKMGVRLRRKNILYRCLCSLVAFVY